ncbi:MAG: TonB-dependent receptor [Leadbetterella sp.]|nr:TonB-dependent receptor [Leadbetterella sp.]
MLRIAGGGGYNNQAQKGVYNGSLLYGNTFFDGKFGFMVAGSIWERNWGTDNLEMVYNMDNHAVESLELRDYLGVRRTQGLNLGTEYNINADNKLFLRGIYTDFKDDETAYEHTFLFSESNFNLRRRRGIVGINLLGGELGGIHESESGRWKLDWKGSAYSTRMDTRQPNGKKNGAYQLTMFTTKAQYGGLAPDGNKYLNIDSPSGYRGDNYRKILPYLNQEIHPEDMNISQVIDIRMGSYERDWVGELNLEHKPSDKLTVKVGGKYRAKYLERGAPMKINVYLGGYAGVPHPLSQYELQDFPANGGFLSELGEHYNTVLLPNITLDQLADIHAKDYSGDRLWMVLNQDEKNPASAASFYTGNENVTAGYAMGTYHFTPQASLVGGLRYEHTLLKYKGNEVVSDETGDQINPVSKSSDFGALLPMIHFKYSPQERLNLRLAYTRTFARANFSDLNPTESITYLTTPASISRGNIDLKPTFSNNFDLLGEYFFKDIGILNAGIFYKALENVIYTARSFQTISGTRYRVSQPENSEKGWLLGFEAGISKRLSFLGGFWGGFGVEGNYTFTRSEMDVPAYSEDANGNITVTKTKEALPSQPKHVFNTALFYENEKAMIRIAGNYKGAALAVVQGNPENYRWYDKNFTVDLSASYKVSRKINLFLELNNLTNEPMKYYQGNSSRPEQVEYYSLRGSAGINLTIF